MDLIKSNKLTGAKRLHRKYELDFMDGFIFSEDHEMDSNIIEFKSDSEPLFLKEIEEYREVQKKGLIKELRPLQVISVKDATLEQGTSEWLEARAGIITASNTPFDSKGKKIPTYENYVDKKVAEAYFVEMGITKEPTHNSEVMDLGHSLEPLAIANYEKRTGNKVVSKGLVVGELVRIGASTDGITTDSDFNKINIEIKSVFLSTYLSHLSREELTKKYYAQMQVQMFVLNIDVTHLLVQCQETDTVDLIITEVVRDEEYISNLIETLSCFQSDFAERYALLKENTRGI